MTKYDCKKYIPFFISGLIVASFLCVVPLTHDDLNAYNSFAKSASLMEMLSYVYTRLFTWSSRFIIEFFLLIFEKMPKPLWAFFSGLFWVVLQWGISKLITDEPEIELNIFLALMSLIFPFITWSSAGWIATSFTYLTPIAAGLITLFPLRYVYMDVDKKKISFIKAAGYTLLMIYACNLEQMAVAISFVYFVIVSYEIISKKVDAFHVWMLILAVLGVLAAVLNPGNKTRTVADTGHWFPSYGMLTLFDKLEIGVTTTASWFMRAQNMFWVIVAFMLFTAIYKRHNSAIYRAIGAMPLLLSLIFILGRSTVGKLIPYLPRITKEIPRNGLVNPTTAFSPSGICAWILIGLLYVSLVISVMLICVNLEELCFWMSLLFAGFGSRWMMGLSPTIYASGFRTCMIMIVFLMAIGGLLFYRNSIVNKKLLFLTMGLVAIVNLGLWGQMLYRQLSV
ncbi:DUF6056 family protein [Butyrivibrio sp. XPD2002]|uniref:DUF6056 family protein n=1 Tax=Butyrivibrio sp. XPD2002 TaxID=1280665 RepID=UPI00040DE84F|nr:DUF6056 family protein [Butyrivibrio sp. XPD2002]